MEENQIRIAVCYYVHVLDGNTNLTRVIEGPLNYILKDHEKLVSGKSPLKMIQIPPRYYCIVKNPVLKDSEGEIIIDEYGMAKVKYGDKEIRTSETHPEPFPLYPLESLELEISKLPIIQPNYAYLLRALRDFVDDKNVSRVAGDQWLFYGPGIYIQRIECEAIKEVSPLTIKPNFALKLRAIRATKDRDNIERKAGEEWLIREPGDYLPKVDEEYVEDVKALVLTEKVAVHLRALKSFTDVYGKVRKAGEE